MYGLSFILFGYVCISIRRLEYNSLPWATLAYFGFIHGVCEWLDLCSISIGDQPAFSLARLLLKTLSFLVLFLFCLQSSPLHLLRKNLALIIGILLIVLIAALTLPLSLAAIDDIVRWGLALPGCIWTALIIHRNTETEFGKRKIHLHVISGAFVCYGLVAGATVPNSEIVPVWAPSHELFLATFHIPVQLARAFFATLAAAALWGYEIELTLSDITATVMRQGFRRTLLTLLAACFVGWVVTYWLGMVDTGPNGRRLLGIGTCLTICLLILAHYAELKRRLNIEITAAQLFFCKFHQAACFGGGKITLSG